MPPKRKTDVKQNGSVPKKQKKEKFFPEEIRRANPKKGNIIVWLQNLTEKNTLEKLKGEMYDYTRQEKPSNIISRTLTDWAYGRIPAEYTSQNKESYYVLNKNGDIDARQYTTFNALALVLHLEMPTSDPKKSIPLLTTFLREFFVNAYIVGKGLSSWVNFWALESNSATSKDNQYFEKLPGKKEQMWMKRLALKHPNFFEKNVILRKDGTRITDWETYRLYFFGQNVQQQNKNVQAQKAVEKQQRPVTISLDRFENVYQQWMASVLIMDKTSPTFKTLKPDLKDLRVVEATKNAPKYYFPSREILRLGFLLQGCIGSRLKGFVLQNKIWSIPFDLSLNQLYNEVSLDNPKDELETAVRTWLNLETSQRQNLVIVTGLSKQKDKTTIERQKALRKAYGSVEPDQKDGDEAPDPTIVKPLLDVYLSAEQFLPLFNYYRQVLMFCVFQRLSTCNVLACKTESEYFKKQYPDIMTAAKKHKKGSLSVSSEFRAAVGENFGLTQAETLSRSFVTSVIYRDIQNEAIKTIQSDLKEFNAESLLKNTSGVHILRKMYTVWSYQLYAKRYIKEVAYSQAVLGHKDLSTSLRYTDIIIDIPPPKGENLVTHFARRFSELEKLVGNIQTAQKEVELSLREVAAMTANAREVIFPRLKLRKFSENEKEENPNIDVDSALDVLERWVKEGTWPKNTPFTQKNMMSIGMGTELRLRVRRTARFKTLNSKIFKKKEPRDDQ